MTDYHKITFEPRGVTIDAADDETVLEVAIRRNIPLRLDCGGIGLCGKCRIIVDPPENLSPPAEAELDLLTPRQISGANRLACQARIKGSLTVTIPDELTDSSETRVRSGLTGTFPVNPVVERIVLSGTPIPEPANGFSGNLSEWVMERATRAVGARVQVTEPDALRQLSRPGMATGDMTLVHHQQRSVIAILPGKKTRSLGLALDLGTTTLAAYLCDLKTGQVLASESTVNPQRRFGDDVISRITRINEQESGLKALQTLIVEGINFLIGRCVERIGADRGDIDEVAAVGNTPMEQIFGEFHPSGLGISPDLPVIQRPPLLKACDLGLKLNPGTPVYLLPVISGFVGGDTLGAILADEPHRRKEISLIVDIGTSGELVLGSSKGLWVTSCATGPALEGERISCGMPAVSGAIHRVRGNGSAGAMRYEVLGQGDAQLPMGLCGPGLIDAVAAMRRSGIILPGGRFNDRCPGVSCDDNGEGVKFVLVPPARTATGSEIAITRQDIRQFLLAKSALSAGIEVLMRKAGVARVDRTILTGAFGARYNWENALALGMLPPLVTDGQIEARDNLAGIGVVKALLDKNRRTEAGRLSRQIKFLELAREPDFALSASESTGFPAAN